MMIQVFIEKLNNGKWASYTQDNPHFYFEGNSEYEVTEIARRAIEFYAETTETIH